MLKQGEPLPHTAEDLEPWVEFQFSRSGGPGGQNVNKVNTRATLLFDFENCDLFDDGERALIRRRLESRLARDGRLRVVSQRERTQRGNRARAIERLIELLTKALTRQRTRKATKPSRASRERRLKDKRQRSETKERRRARYDD